MVRGYLLLLVLLCYRAVSDRILMVLDNADLTKTHRKLVSMLRQSNQVTIADSFAAKKIELKKYDRFLYDHVMIMGLSSKQIDSKIKVADIVSYFDEGGNVVIVGDIDTSKSYRKLFDAFGVELDEYGSKLKDHFSHHLRPDILTTSNYVGTPFLNLHKPLLYQGIGLKLGNYENYQLYDLISSEHTAFSRNYIEEETTRIGRITLAAAVQGLNNARALLIGSLGFFSDSALNETSFANQDAVADLLAWTFQRKGVLRVKSMYYYGQGAQSKETLFNVGEKIYFECEVEIQRGSEWVPYSTEDMQVEFVMLDPWVLMPLTQVPNTSVYKAEFYAPSKQGIYQFKIIYKKPGYTFLTETERVTLRPYKHDEYERYLYVASPYFFGLFSSVFGTFLFTIVYLYSGFPQLKSKKQ